MATLFSLLLAILFLFYPSERATPAFFEGVSHLMTGAALLFLLLIPLLNIFLIRPIQKISLKLTPLAGQQFRHDHLYQIANLSIVSFALLSLALAADPGFLQIENKTALFAFWIFLLGFAIDATWLIVRRAYRYADPLSVTHIAASHGYSGIQNDNEKAILESINALTEITSSDIGKGALTLSGESLDHLTNLFGDFIHSYISIAHRTTEEDVTHDEASVVLLFLLQRFDLIIDQAIAAKNEALVTEVMTAGVKVALHAAKLDLSLATYPLHFIRRSAEKALAAEMRDPPIKTTYALVEMAKTIPEEIDITYAELQPPYGAIIATLETVAKELFRRDKTTPFSILRGPFLDLKEFFGRDPIKTHRDGRVIADDCQRVLDELATLESVMNTIPRFTEETPQTPEEEPTPESPPAE